ncbi:MAG: 2-phosphosulfolactate phosphatase [Planctomycetia bacterium]
MPLHWHCHELFHRMPPGAVAGGIAVVIDVLRASTTIATALAHGATRVRPVPGIDEARSVAAALGSGGLLGGERGGVRIAGFDLGNSPLEYTCDRIAGRPLVITTTNGTAALAACRSAREVLVGAVVNATAVAVAVRHLAAATGATDAHLVCAGTDGSSSGEDLLGAGAILAAAAAAGSDDVLDDTARAARVEFDRVLAAADPRGTLVAEFRRAPGGANLVALGMEADLVACAARDSIGAVPRLEPATGWLVEMVPAGESG